MPKRTEFPQPVKAVAAGDREGGGIGELDRLRGRDMTGDAAFRAAAAKVLAALRETGAVPQSLGSSSTPAEAADVLADYFLRETLARAGRTCGALCDKEAPLEVRVIEPTYTTAEVVARGAESRLIRAPRPSFDEPDLIAYYVVEDRYAGVAQRLEWPDVPRRRRQEPARLVAHAIARANRMRLISTWRAPLGGHLVRLRHSLSGGVPLPPMVMLTILVEGDAPLVLPPIPQPPPVTLPPSDEEVGHWLLRRAERFHAAGRKAIREMIFVECRNSTGATETQMRRVWRTAVRAELRRKPGERG
jgi:hypothetical protein